MTRLSRLVPSLIATLALQLASPRTRRVDAQATQAAKPVESRESSAHGVKSTAYRSRVLGLFHITSGEPIADAQVLDIATGWSAKTTATGTVALVFLADGGSIVRIRKIGYASLTVPIAISPKDTTPLTLTMTKVTELATVVTRDTARHFISPALNGFDERARLHATGYFVMDSILRKEENRTVGNVLRSHFPGVVLSDGPGGAMYLMASMRCSVGGPPEVYLDGVAVNAHSDKGSKPFDLNSIGVTELAGIEFYPSTDEVPIQFAHRTAGCGALLLWTRER
jgi:hypothetical protein